ncbi:MAG TPA: M6 family metalloprotease domain-containing protein [Acidobacteriota bacterium]|nr:M6 family metalloprotease domain-containing protein [Acidobacteriota bacterium]HQO18923.1 M6 family metalloprotease domain-containing protein [Acidobacteriota bacterium]
MCRIMSLKSARSFLAGIVLIALFQAGLFALEPPRPGEIEKYRSDGTLQQRIEFAKSLRNHKVSNNLAFRLDGRLNGEASMAPPLGWQGMPTTGNVKILAIMIGFNDYPPNTDTELVYGRMFGDGPGTFPYESLRNFYFRSSYGLLEFSGDALGWYVTPYPRSSVQESTTGRESLIKEVLNHYDEMGHDFSQYDNDGDGTIDYLVVIWTGPDNGWANFWWGYMTSFQDSSFKLDGKRLGGYSWQWESNPEGGKFSARVVIHETGHALGLPDYYDYDDWTGPSGGVGGLDQMDGNWGDHNCFSKMLLEWLTPQVVTTGFSSPVLSPTSEAPEALLVMPEAKAGEQFAEYYMIQYRRTTENDVVYPNDGLIVWHVDARTDTGGYDFLYDNSYSSHKLLRLMEADGLEEIEQNKWADGGDFYTEGYSIGPQTAPSSSRYSSLPSGIQMDSITEAGDTIGCSLSLPSSAVTLTSVQKLKNPFRLVVSGTGIQEGAKAVIGTDSAYWPTASFQNGSITLEKGKKLKKKFRIGSTVKIMVVNPDGSAGTITYKR